jgi:hypothetical protein
MPRLKRGSSILDDSEKRLTVLQTINVPENDAELSLDNIHSSIEQTRAVTPQ